MRNAMFFAYTFTAHTQNLRKTEDERRSNPIEAGSMQILPVENKLETTFFCSLKVAIVPLCCTKALEAI